MISLDSLASMRTFAADPMKRAFLLKDNTLIDGLVLLLSNEAESVIILTLEVFLHLVESSDGRAILNNHRYLQIQLEETVRCDSNEVSSKADKLIDLLKETSAANTPHNNYIYQTPKNKRSSYSQRSHQSSVGHSAKYKTIVLQLKGLFDKHDRELCTRLLIKVKGMISIIFDMNRARCTVRVLSKVQPETLTETIARSQTMSAQQIVKNELGEEVIVAFGSEAANTSIEGGPDYLDEIASPQPDDKAMCRTGTSKNSSSSGGWLKTAANFLTNSFW